MRRKKWPEGKRKLWNRDAAPLGAVDTRIRGVRMIKIRMDGPKSRRWVNLARYRWEQVHGRIPPGKRVIHLDGDPLNDEFSNYALMTPGEFLQHLWRTKKGCRERNRKAAAAGTARANRERPLVALRIGPLPAKYWFPVDVGQRLIVLDPERGRWRLVARYMGGPLEPDINGRRSLRYLLRGGDIRFLRGDSLRAEEFEGFRRIEPEAFRARRNAN